eukprot:gene4289-3980_t
MLQRKALLAGRTLVAGDGPRLGGPRLRALLRVEGPKAAVAAAVLAVGAAAGWGFFSVALLCGPGTRGGQVLHD